MNLSNHFLVAMPDMEDAFFAQSVVYICKHDNDGAIGIAINKPSPITMDLIFSATGKNIPFRMQHDSVMMGGPVQVERGYVVHTPIGSWQSSIEGAVDKILISIGYSSWGKGQLERELADNAWLTVPADEHILFDIPYEQRYAAAFAKLGIDPIALISGVGHA